MGLPFVNWAAIPPQGNEFFRNFGDTLSKSMLFPQEFMQKALETQKQQALAPYWAKEEQENLLKAQLANQKSTAESPYWGKLSEADLKYKLAQAARQKALSNLPFGGQYLPGPAGQIAGLEAIKSQYGQDSPQYKDAKRLFDANIESMQYRGLGTGGREEKYFEDLVAKDNPQLKPEQIYEASNVLRQGGNKLADGTLVNPLSPASRASYDRMVKYSNTSQGLNQQRYANTLEGLLPGASKNLKGAVTYSGLLGNGRGSLDMVSQLLGGKDSPLYQQYINFTRTDVPVIAGELMRELGVNASDEQKKMYKEVVNPISWDTNPRMALSRWEYFVNLASKVARSVSQSPSTIQQNLQNTKSPNNKNNNELPKALETENPKNAPNKSSNNKKVVKIVRDANGKLTFSK